MDLRLFWSFHFFKSRNGHRYDPVLLFVCIIILDRPINWNYQPAEARDADQFLKLQKDGSYLKIGYLK